MPIFSPRVARALLTTVSALALAACQQPVFEDPPPRFNTGYGQGGAYGRPPIYDAPVAAPDYYGADPQPPVTATDVLPPSRPVPPPPSYPTYERPPVASAPLPPPSSAPVAPTARSYPVGRPVPGKPGFVISPFSPNSGYVDVKGFNSGEQVKDPYSGKIFLVP